MVREINLSFENIRGLVVDLRRPWTHVCDLITLRYLLNLPLPLLLDLPLPFPPYSVLVEEA